MTNADRFPTFRAAGRLLRRLGRLAGWGWRFLRPVLAALVLFVLGAYVATNVTAGRELEHELALVRQQGEPLSLTEAAPAPVPDDENAALVYEQAFNALPRRVEYAPKVANAREQRLAREDEALLSDFFSDKPEIRNRVTMAQVRGTLVGTKEALALARQAAAMPQCRFPVDWEAGAGALFPHYAKLRSLARLLAAHAVVAAADGRTEEAVSDLEAVVGLARHCGEPLLIGQIVQYACLSIGCDALGRVLEVSSPDEAECRRLAGSLAGVDLYAPFERAIITERVFGLWCFDAWRRDPGQLSGALGVDDSRPFFPDRMVEMALRSDPFLKKDQILYLRYMAGKIALARQRRHVPVTRLSPDEAEFPRYAQLSHMITPVFSAAHNKRDETIARLGLARWALALHAYRQRAGRYPERLAEERSLLGWELPDDPFSEQPFVYRRQGDSYSLYSVGVNVRDDSGRNDRIEPRPEPVNPRMLPPPSPGWDDIKWRAGG